MRYTRAGCDEKVRTLDTSPVPCCTCVVVAILLLHCVHSLFGSFVACIIVCASFGAAYMVLLVCFCVASASFRAMCMVLLLSCFC